MKSGEMRGARDAAESALAEGGSERDEAQRERDAASNQVEKLREEAERLQSTITEFELQIKASESTLNAECQKTAKDILMLQTGRNPAQREATRLRTDNQRHVSANAELQRLFAAAKGQVETLEAACEKGLRAFDKAMVELKGAAKKEQERLKANGGEVEGCECGEAAQGGRGDASGGKGQGSTRNSYDLQLHRDPIPQVGKGNSHKGPRQITRTTKDLRDAIQRNKTREEQRPLESQAADALSQWAAQQLTRKCQALAEAEKQLDAVRGEAEDLRLKQMKVAKEDPETRALRRELKGLKKSGVEAQETAKGKLQSDEGARGVTCKAGGSTTEDPEKVALRRDLQLLKIFSADTQKTMDRKP